MIPVIMRHDYGCENAREADGGHSDAAKRMCDWYNLHKSAGAPVGHWIAIGLLDGSSDGCAYPTKIAAMRHMHGHERDFTYVQLQPVSMSLCQAASVLYMRRVTDHIAQGHSDLDEKHGGLVLIESATTEDRRRQIQAIRTGNAMVALGYPEGNTE
jgi:hypothetical protein